MSHICFRYDSSTGTFTVPSGGDGMYYFSTYLLVDDGEVGRFSIRVNGEILCTALGDLNANGGNDYPQATCSGLTQLAEGFLQFYSPLTGLITKVTHDFHMWLLFLNLTWLEQNQIFIKQNSNPTQAEKSIVDYTSISVKPRYNCQEWLALHHFFRWRGGFGVWLWNRHNSTVARQHIQLQWFHWLQTVKHKENELVPQLQMIRC